MRLAIALVGVLLLTAGCAAFTDEEPDRSRLDLAVQNERERSVSVVISVTDADGETIANESARLDAGVGRTYDFTVGATGRYEVVVAGADWRGRVTWNADTCARHEATVRISEDRLGVASECARPR